MFTIGQLKIAKIRINSEVPSKQLDQYVVHIYKGILFSDEKNNNSCHLRQAKNKSQTYCRGGRGRGIKQGRESKGDYSDGSWVT